MTSHNRVPPDLSAIEVPLERDLFLRSLIRSLSGTLEDVVGLEEASGFVSIVGQEIGSEIDRMYREALGRESLDVAEVTAVLVDLKRRIEGDFYVIEQDEEKIVLGNRACPFAEKVHERPSLCMMTSNVFGVIAAENLGYGRVELERTIATGAPQCRVVVHLRPTEGPLEPGQREYFRS